jgi:hypothetical protein
MKKLISLLIMAVFFSFAVCASYMHCNDTDGGQVYDVAGNITFTYASVPQTTDWDIRTDACQVNGYETSNCTGSDCFLTERGCSGSGYSWDITAVRVNCNELGYAGCRQGACYGSSTPEPSCSDDIKNRDEEGIDCGGRYCSSCSVAVPAVNASVSSAAAQESCSDNDGGRNYYQKGTACIGTKCLTDYCMDSNHVMEYDCGSNQGITSNDGCEHDALGGCSYLCQYGCSDGACQRTNITSPRVVCNDSDGGINIYVAGTTYGDTGRLENGIGTSRDYCTDDDRGTAMVDEGQYVHEYTCEGGFVVAYTNECPLGCRQDACIRSSSESAQVIDSAATSAPVDMSQQSAGNDLHDRGDLGNDNNQLSSVNFPQDALQKQGILQRAISAVTNLFAPRKTIPVNNSRGTICDSVHLSDADVCNNLNSVSSSISALRNELTQRIEDLEEASRNLYNGGIEQKCRVATAEQLSEALNSCE